MNEKIPPDGEPLDAAEGVVLGIAFSLGLWLVIAAVAGLVYWLIKFLIP